MTEFESLVKTLLDELSATLRSVSSDEVATLKEAILQARRIFVAGRGRSGLQMNGFAMRLMHLGLTVHVVGDVTTPSIGAGDLLVIGSASGHTASLVEYAKRAASLKAQVALITATPSSPIADIADYVVHIPAPSPKVASGQSNLSAQPMASLFEQALGLLLDILTMQLMYALDITVQQMFARHANLE